MIMVHDLSSLIRSPLWIPSGDLRTTIRIPYFFLLLFFVGPVLILLGSSAHNRWQMIMVHDLSSLIRSPLWIPSGDLRTTIRIPYFFLLLFFVGPVLILLGSSELTVVDSTRARFFGGDAVLDSYAFCKYLAEWELSEMEFGPGRKYFWVWERFEM